MSKKSDKYLRLITQLKGLLETKSSFIAQVSTINAVLYHKNPGFFWVGFYLVVGDKLIVGPYQGPVACQVLGYPKGVCWAAVNSEKSIIVQNVEEFPDHIACDSRSKSEIVIPVKNSNGKVIAIMDIDSDKVAYFDKEDEAELEKIIKLLNQEFVDQVMLSS